MSLMDLKQLYLDWAKTTSYTACSSWDSLSRCTSHVRSGRDTWNNQRSNLGLFCINWLSGSRRLKWREIKGQTPPTPHVWVGFLSSGHPTRGFPVTSVWSLVRLSRRLLVRMLSLSLPLLEPLSTWAFHSLNSSNGEQRRNLTDGSTWKEAFNCTDAVHSNFPWGSFSSHYCPVMTVPPCLFVLLEKGVHVQQVILNGCPSHCPAGTGPQLTHSYGRLHFWVLDVVGFVQNHPVPGHQEEWSWGRWRSLTTTTTAGVFIQVGLYLLPFIINTGWC